MRKLCKRSAAALLCLLTLCCALPARAAAALKNTDIERYYLYLNIPDQVLTVYEKDDAGDYTRIVRRMLCTTGADETPTPSGTYRLGAKEHFGKFANFNNEYARYWTQVVRGIYLHSIMFSKRDAETLKSSPYSTLGRRDSHGCIRLYVEDAKWLYYHAPPGTRITIGGENRISVAEKKGLRSTLSFQDYKAMQMGMHDMPLPPNRTAWVTEGGAQLRTGNGSNDKFIANLKAGTALEVLQEGDPWVKVLVDGREGYVKRIHVTYTQGVEETYPDGRATKTTTSIYAAPDIKSEVLCRVPRDTSLNILETDPEAGWYKIRHWNEEGYVRIRNTKTVRSMFPYDEAAQLAAYEAKKQAEATPTPMPALTPTPSPAPTSTPTPKPTPTLTPEPGATPAPTPTQEPAAADSDAAIRSDAAASPDAAATPEKTPELPAESTPAPTAETAGGGEAADSDGALATPVPGAWVSVGDGLDTEEPSITYGKTF